jgi:hypothetical protein
MFIGVLEANVDIVVLGVVTLSHILLGVSAEAEVISAALFKILERVCFGIFD